MKQNWTYKKFTDVCDVQYGYAFDSKCFTDDDSAMPLIRIRDVMRGYSETFYNGTIPDGYTINEGDYLVGMDGEFNIGRWGKRAGLLNQRVCKMVSSSPLLHNQYMYYFLKVCLKNIEDETPFVTVKHLSAKRINQIKIPLPPLSTQQSIVAELDEINNLLSLKRKELDAYDKLAQSLFYEMFGDPVDNEKGWEVKKLGEVCEIIAGGDKPNDIKVIRANDYIYPIIANGEGDKGILGYSNRYRISKPSVTIGARGASIGNCRIVTECFTPVVRLITLTPQENINVTFLYFYAKGINYNSNGAGQAQLTVPNIKSENIPLPPLSLQQTFATRIEAIEEQKASVKAAIEKLETLLAARMQYWFE